MAKGGVGGRQGIDLRRAVIPRPRLVTVNEPLELMRDIVIVIVDGGSGRQGSCARACVRASVVLCRRTAILLR